MFIRTVSLGAVLAVAACANPAADRRAADQNAFAPARASAEQSDCFASRNISGYSEVDRDTVRLKVGVRDYYDVDVTPACYGLEWQTSLAVVTRSSFICVDDGPGQGDIVTDEDRCMITEVRHSPRRPAEGEMTAFEAAQLD